MEAQMSRHLGLFGCLFAVVLGGVIQVHTAPQASAQSSAQDHVAWVAQALKHMQTIRVGMTRADLLKIFTTEGGTGSGLQRKFVSRDCPYFKVDVEFTAVGRPNRDKDGRVTLVEGSRDIIVKISKPYLQFSVMD
jgi:hypothetical protein